MRFLYLNLTIILSSLFLTPALGQVLPLSAQLVAFTTQTPGPGTVQINWTTATETGTDYFALERSSDGLRFAEINRLPAAGTSTSPRTYAYLDAALPVGTAVVSYRLRLVDLDGSIYFSPVKTAAVVLAAAPALPSPTVALWPNPVVGNSAWLTGVAPHQAVQVLDGLGRLVLATQANATGAATVLLPAGLAAGSYVVRAGARTFRLIVD